MALRALLDFIYETIERSRRRAVSEMLALAEAGAGAGESADDVVRRRILSYLETSHSEQLEQVISRPSDFVGLRQIIEGSVDEASGELKGGVQSAVEADRIAGQTGRLLESYPDDPRLLLIRGGCELMGTQPDIEFGVQSLEAALDFGRTLYDAVSADVVNHLIWLLVKLRQLGASNYTSVVERLLDGSKGSALALAFLGEPALGEDVLVKAGRVVFSELGRRAVEAVGEERRVRSSGARR